MSILGDEILREIEAVKASYAAKCHIELTGRKHASAQVERKPVEGHTLALVYRYCPCQLQWELREGAGQLLLHLAFFLVLVVAVRFP